MAQLGNLICNGAARFLNTIKGTIEKSDTVLQKQLHYTGSNTEEHKMLFSFKETTSTDQNRDDAYDGVDKNDGFSYHISDMGHGLVITTPGKNMAGGDYLEYTDLTNKQLMLFSRSSLSAIPNTISVKPDDIVMGGSGTWDGTNYSLKTAITKAKKGITDYTLTNYGSSTNCNWSDSFVEKNNGVVHLNAFVEVTSNLSAGDIIFTFTDNTPLSIHNIGDAGIPVVVEDFNDNISLNYIYSSDNTSLYIKKPVSANTYINVNFVYLNNYGE